MRDRIMDLAKTVLIYALTASMLASAGYYINARQNAGQRDEIPWEKRRIFEGGVVFAEPDAAQFAPVQITVTLGGSSRTAAYDDILTAQIYGHDFIRFALPGLFNRYAQCVPLGGARGEDYWRRAASSENSLYIRYAGDYVYPVIYAFLSPESDIGTGEAVAKVRELFIVDMDPVFGLSRDSQGNVAAFIPGEGIARDYISENINTFLQFAYDISEGAGLPVRFLGGGRVSGGQDIINLSFPASFHLLGGSPIYSPALAFENPLAGGELMQRAYMGSLFRLLNFNYEGARSSRVADGAVYRDAAAYLRVAGGQLIYTHSEGGLHLSRFLGYDADYYSFAEKLRAASVFASSLPSELAGGTGSRLLLTDIFYDGGDLGVVFAYYHGGVKLNIAGTGGAALILRISQGGIREAVINALRVTPGARVKNLDPALMLRETDRRISQGGVEPEELNLRRDGDRLLVNRLELIYNIDLAGGAGEAKPVWVLR